MPVALYTGKLSDKQRIGGKFLHLHVELVNPSKITFEAGQYLLLNCPLTPQKRQYSIVSAPRLEHGIELLIEEIPHGVASGYLAGLEPGAEVSFYAPAGEFTIKEDVQSSDVPLVFIGTGSGVAPLRSMVLDQLRTKETKRPLHLYWGMRHVEDLFWLEYFEELHQNFPNFSYHITLSQAPDAWTLCRGRVTDCLSIHELPLSAHFYICGNSKMITDVMGVLAGRGVPESHIHHEKFT